MGLQTADSSQIDSDAVMMLCVVFSWSNSKFVLHFSKQMAQKVLLIVDSFIIHFIVFLFTLSKFHSINKYYPSIRFIMRKTFKSPQTKTESKSIESRVRFFAQPTLIFPSEMVEERDFDALKKRTWYQSDDLKSFRSSLMTQSSRKGGQGSEWDPFDTRSFSERQHNRVLSNRLIVHVANKLRQSDNTLDSETLGAFAQKICHRATEEAAEAGFRAFYYAYADGKRDRVEHDAPERCVRQRIAY